MILVLTEQMNLIDVLSLQGYEKIHLLYSPLTLVTRLLIDAIWSHYVNEDRLVFHFCPSNTPIMAEYKLVNLIEKLEKPVHILSNTGSIANHLVTLKLAAKYNHVKLV